MTTDLTARQVELKETYIAELGPWTDAWEVILRQDPGFFETYMELALVPWRSGTLEPKVKEMVYLAMDAAATHLYEPGIREHIRAALSFGATKAELLEVIELASTLGIHAPFSGVPVLLEVLDEKAMRTGTPEWTDRQQQIKSEFVENRGYWHESWDGILEVAPELLDTYSAFSSVPWKTGVLEPKVKELIYCAFDASATHLYLTGLKAHMTNALGLGASAQEIAEVLTLVSVVGIHGAVVAVPILEEEVAKLKVGAR